MARYRTTIRTDRPVDEAFTFMADLRNFEAWDPGVQQSVQVVGDGPGPDAEYDVTVNAPGKGLTLRYVTTEFTPPNTAVVRAANRMLTSLDRIHVAEDDEGTLVTYDAELTLSGPLGVFDVLLRPLFDRIGAKADAGLQRALDGQRV